MAEPGQTLPDGFRLVRRMASPRAWLAVHPDTPRRPVLVREPAPQWHTEVVHAPPDQELTWFDGGLALAWRIDGAALMSEGVGPWPVAEVQRLLDALQPLLDGDVRLDPEVLLWGGGSLRILPTATRVPSVEIAGRAALLSWLIHPSFARVLEGRLDNRPLRDAPSINLLAALDMRVATEPLPPATIAGVSCAGLRRNINEDALAWVDTGGWRLVAVADGMGGNMSGEPASHAAVAAMLTVLDTEPDDEADAKDKLHTAFERARDQVGMFELIGTTLVCALVGGGVAHILHIGDSLAWRVTRFGVVARLTEPHTLESLMVQNGRDPEDPNVQRHRNVLVRSLFRPAAEGEKWTRPEYCRVPLLPGEQILLATDGLYGQVSDDQIGAILVGTEGPRAGVAALLRAAHEAGAPDNITIALFAAP